ncbi:MAG: diphosphomevalonate decarboxylase, partial [Kiritimatiellia bacterium]|nr:diphosphomevalonate decarboxylase [Kiritimatiellia bacterium]
AWPATVAADLEGIREAILQRDFERMGRIAEGNALAMHATLMAARPSVTYATAATLEAQARVTRARKEGVAVYFTMDAGPNLKLLFPESERSAIERLIPDLRIVGPVE